MLSIEPVTAKNRAHVEGLRVRAEQQNFIETTAQCMKEADQLPLWRPVALMRGADLVGFAMYGLWAEEGARGRVWLDRLLIDARFQGQGLGKEALTLLIDRIRAEYGCEELYLSLYEDNVRALRLYEEAGFRLNGQRDANGELVMVLTLDKGD